jgi:acylphosphatase
MGNMSRDSSQGMERLHLRIFGFVQGVSFRWHTRQQAQALGLTGWTKNLSDGSVEVVAEGPRARLEDLLAWCRQGPDMAEVDRVEESYSAATGEFSGFNVTRG